MGLALIASAAGCTAQQFGEFLGTRTPASTLPVDRATVAMQAGQFGQAQNILTNALALYSGQLEPGDPTAVHLLVLSAEADARSSSLDAADDALLRAIAIAAPIGPVDQPTSQRGARLHMARVFEGIEDVERAEAQLTASLELCEKAPEVEDAAQCNTERLALVALFETTGRRDEAEPFMMAALSAVQQDWGAYDIRLAFALTDTAKFYYRGGQYHLAEPLLARSRSLWKGVVVEAHEAFEQAKVELLRDPFGSSITKLSAGNAPFSIEPGSEVYNELLRKLGRREEAESDREASNAAWATAKIAEERAWAVVNKTEPSSNTTSQLERKARRSDLPRAADLHAAGWVLYHQNKRRVANEALEEAEGIYAQLWPGFDAADRRRLAPSRIELLELLAEFKRSTSNFAGAMADLERARDIARTALDLSDERRLDLFLLAARVQREAGDFETAESLVSVYLDHVRDQRGDDHPDRAWGLRNLAWALVAQDETEKAAEAEGEAQGIWERWAPVYPGF